MAGALVKAPARPEPEPDIGLATISCTHGMPGAHGHGHRSQAVTGAGSRNGTSRSVTPPGPLIIGRGGQYNWQR